MTVTVLMTIAVTTARGDDNTAANFLSVDILQGHGQVGVMNSISDHNHNKNERMVNVTVTTIVTMTVATSMKATIPMLTTTITVGTLTVNTVI